jgi:hypothetical protein
MYLIEIHDITGKLVIELKTEGSAEMDIDISTYRRGIYFIRLRSEKGDKLMKFLKI